MVVAAAIVALAFTGITVQFIVAMVESYIIVAAGFIFLGFGGSRWTVPYTERYIGLAVSIGLKIMLLYLLIGTGMSLSVEWMTDAQKVSTAVNPAMSAFEIMGASLIFLMLWWQIPKLFSAVLGGAPALSGGDLISTGTGLVAGAATVASLGAGTVAIAARGASAIAGVSAAANAGAGSGAGASVQAPLEQDLAELVMVGAFRRLRVQVPHPTAVARSSLIPRTEVALEVLQRTSRV